MPQLPKKIRIKLAMFNLVCIFAMAFASRDILTIIIFSVSAIYLIYEVTTVDN